MATTEETTLTGVKVQDEAKPAQAGIAEWFKTFFPSEADPIFKLFDSEFHVGEVWDALSAVSDLGKKAEAYLESIAGGIFGATRGPATVGTVVAATVTNEELCQQLASAMRPATGGAAITVAEGAGAPAPVAMNPVIAGLLISLAKRAAEELISRLGGLFGPKG